MLKLLRTNIIYAVGSIANSAALFLLIPYLVNHLSVAEYGAWSLFEIGIMIFTLVALPGLDVGLMREYWTIEDEKERVSLNSTVLISTLVLGGGLMVGGGALIWGLKNFQSFPDAPRSLFIALGAGFLEALLTVFLTIFRVREEAWRFTGISLIRMLIFMGGSIGYIAMGWGLSGALLGRLTGTGISLIAAFFLSRPYIAASFSCAGLKRMFNYGFPLLPTKITQYVLLASDRYIMKFFMDLEAIGIYSFGYKIAAGLDILITRPFSTDWGVRRFQIAKRADAPRLFAQVLLGYLAISILAALFLWSITPDLYHLIAPETYQQGLAVVPIILASYVIYGLSFPINVGIMLLNKTKYAPWIGLIAASICIILNLVLIPPFGMFGAAWATLLSYASWTFGIAVVSMRFYRVPYNLKALLLLALASLGSFWGIQGIGNHFGGETFSLMPSLIKIVWLFAVFGGVVFFILRLEGIPLKFPTPLRRRK